MILVIFCEIKEGCFEKVSMASSLVSRKTDAFPPKQKRSEERIIAVLFSSFLLSQPRLYKGGSAIGLSSSLPHLLFRNNVNFSVMLQSKIYILY